MQIINNVLQLIRGANDARGDDINTIKKAVANFLNKCSDTQPPLQADDRSTRGLQHDTTGRLLCPIEYDWDDIEYAIIIFSDYFPDAHVFSL